MGAIVANVGDVFPAKKETAETARNPGAVVDASGNALDPWLLTKAQDKAWNQNIVLVEEYETQLKESPSYGQQLGDEPSWAVYTAAAEAGGLDFQQQRLGPAVKTLVATPKT